MNKPLISMRNFLIHKLGGLTEEDVRIRTRPVPCAVSRLGMETLRVNHLIRREMLDRYPEYKEKAYMEMVYRIADRMIENRLIQFESKEESPDTIVVTATAKVFRPEE